jgi:hypothetical protein
MKRALGWHAAPTLVLLRLDVVLGARGRSRASGSAMFLGRSPGPVRMNLGRSRRERKALRSAFAFRYGAGIETEE